jgi:flavin reductase (DIM6/NTAB) family NADH-FMN oxidoreductase RutF
MGNYGQIDCAVAPQATMKSDMTTVALDDSKALRRAFGRFGTGVTVITTQSDDGPLGMTANSFSSVSLEPPLVLWSAALRSKRHDVFAKAEHFCIHILGEDQQDLANHFATQGHDFDICDWAQGPGGAPQLAGCLAAFHCRAHAVHPAGDHSVSLGEVIQAAECPGQGAGLLFDKGRFGRFSPKP